MTAANVYLPAPAKVLDVRHMTASDWTLRAAWPQAPRPGQFFEVSLPRVGEAPISVSGFGEGFVDFTIRRVGRVTSQLARLSPGQRVFLRGPYGNGFPLEKFHGRHLIIVAGGTGLSPVKGVIEHFLPRRQLLSGLDVLVGFKSPADILFADQLAAWSSSAQIQLTVDRPAEGWTGCVGLITERIAPLEIPRLAEVEAVVVGPPMMMKHAIAALLARGLSERQVWVSYERRMSCGIGKCGHCKIHDTYVCVDGPVFNFEQARMLKD